MENQIDRLATFILENCPGEPSKSEGAVDTAIRLLGDSSKSIKNMKELVQIQGHDGNWDHDEYMRGMYNGMELMLATAEGREPNYKEPIK